MTTYTTNRDGGKTNEEGHIRFQTKVWSGNIVSGLQAVQRSPLAMGINISVGDAKVDYSTYGYTVWTDAIESVSIATADPSNPRIDRIVCYVDRAVTPSSTNSNNPGIVKFKSVAGTPAASPSAPSDVTVQTSVGASNPYFDIARVLVGTGVTTIDNSKITDTRVLVSATLAPGSVTNGLLNLSVSTAIQTADVASSNETIVDITGATLSLVAGTYIIMADFSCARVWTIGAGIGNIVYQLRDGSNTVLETKKSGDHDTPGERLWLPTVIATTIVIGSTTTVKMSGACTKVSGTEYSSGFRLDSDSSGVQYCKLKAIKIA